MKKGIGNFKTAIADPSTRTTWIISMAVLVIVIAIGLLVFMKKSTSSSDVSQIKSAPDTQRSSGSKAVKSAVYQQIVQEENLQKANKAKTDGTSAVPVINPTIDLNIKPSVATSTVTTVDRNTQRAQEQQMAEARARREKARQEHQQLLQRYKENLRRQSQGMLVRWTSPVAVTNVMVSSTELAAASNKSISSSQSAQNQGQGTGTTTGTDVSLVKAGKVCYALLDTGVNTDETKDVRATLANCKTESGKSLTGSPLLGKVELTTQWAEAAVLRFTLMSPPWATSSMKIDALAIDESTYRAAVASDVDHHYVMKSIGLFASGFLEGINEGLLKGGQSQSVVSTDTSTTVVTEEYTNKQLMMLGLSKVGAKAGTAAASLYNRPNTVSIEKGTGIGIVFMSDIK